MSAETLNVIEKEHVIRMLRLYKLPSGSGRYTFGSLLGADGKPKYPDMNGRTVSFIGGRYATDDPREIEELDGQVNAGHTDIQIDPREKEIDARSNDPMFRLREQIRGDILRELDSRLNPRDMGSYDSGRLAPGNTNTIAAVVPGSIGLSPAQTAALSSLTAGSIPSVKK